MNRREFVVATSAALVATAFRHPVFAQQPGTAPAAPAFNPIRRNVGYYPGRGGTIGWMVNTDAVIAVDTGYADAAQTALGAFKAQANGRQIDCTLITHHHGDHTGGLAVFGPASQKSLSHERVPELMKMVASAQKNAPPPVLPTATFGTVWEEQAGDERFVLRHHGPAHTGGDAVIRFNRANVIHMGDLLFYEIHPRVDRPAGASIQNWMKTLEQVEKDASNDTLFIAGHARPGASPVVKREALRGLRNYFDAVLTHVRKGIAAQTAQADIISVTALPGFGQYQSLGQVLTLAGTLTAAYEELSAGK
jgi:glyoxylase-like metal-dependent hydrolase (beta-lactamase superfamily II)